MIRYLAIMKLIPASLLCTFHSFAYQAVVAARGGVSAAAAPPLNGVLSLFSEYIVASVSHRTFAVFGYYLYSVVTMSIRRKSFFVKLMKLVGKGNQVHSSKPCLAQIREERKKQRQRTSLSSSLCSQIEPMPTIMEEDEFSLDAFGECSRI